MVFIAYNYDGKPINIVNARSRELAVAFWQGKEIFPHTIENLEDKKIFVPIDKHITGVYSILETKEIKLHINGRSKKFVCVIK